ncbi:hypothetical protein BDZ91DRAFT_745968 [Kalaharituber pfeilii]|nr:hypothetical protein BDZ91DRAFT_745968 [Kalaharituber pfeilii]
MDLDIRSASCVNTAYFLLCLIIILFSLILFCIDIVTINKDRRHYDSQNSMLVLIYT